MNRLRESQLKLLAGTGFTLALAIWSIMWGLSIPNVEGVFDASKSARQGFPSGLHILVGTGLLGAGVVGGILLANLRSVRGSERKFSISILIVSAVLAILCAIWGVVQARNFRATYAGGLGKTVESLETRLETCARDASEAPAGIVKQAMTDGCAAQQDFINQLKNDARTRADSGVPEAKSAEVLQQTAREAPLPAQPGDLERPAEQVIADAAAYAKDVMDAKQKRDVGTAQEVPAGGEGGPRPPGLATGQPSGKSGGPTPFEQAAALSCLYYGVPPQVCGSLIDVFNDLLGGNFSSETVGEVLYLVGQGVGSDGKLTQEDAKKLVEDIKNFDFDNPEEAFKVLDKALDVTADVIGSNTVKDVREEMRQIESLYNIFKSCVPQLREDAREILAEEAAGTATDPIEAYSRVQLKFTEKIKQRGCYKDLGKILGVIGDVDIEKCVLRRMAEGTAFRAQAESLVAADQCRETFKILRG